MTTNLICCPRLNCWLRTFNRSLCFPSSYLRHSHQFAEHDVCHLHEGVEKRPVFRKHPSPLSWLTVLPKVSLRRRVSPRFAYTRPLQLPQPELLVTTAGKSRSKGTCRGGRIHNRTPSAPKRKLIAGRRTALGVIGNVFNKHGCTRWAI